MEAERVLRRGARKLRQVTRTRQARSEPYSVERNRRDDAALVAVMAAVLRPASCCVDVGAHEGTFLRHMVRIAPQGRHIAFEPLQDHAVRLSAAFGEVDVRTVALGDRHGQAQFMRRGEPALSSLETVPEGEDPEAWRGPIYDDATRATVDLRRLDDELPRDFVPALIKIDVEGVEHAVLAGGQETLARHRPVVAVEHSVGATHHGYEAGGIHDLLRPCGLRIFDADGNGPYSREEMTRTVLDGQMWFWFAFRE
jgi:FkbM family methyltransferase